ncbi:MAG: hypothetical protein DHS20C03_34680 [Minwuia thermotolerans]|nr:MAG: hypothetical protein DHS20C03_34680 [Minwuia thermotolerans]
MKRLRSITHAEDILEIDGLRIIINAQVQGSSQGWSLAEISDALEIAAINALGQTTVAAAAAFLISREEWQEMNSDIVHIARAISRRKSGEPLPGVYVTRLGPIRTAFRLHRRDCAMYIHRFVIEAKNSDVPFRSMVDWDAESNVVHLTGHKRGL